MRPIPKGNVIVQVAASPAAVQEETHASLCFRTHMRDRHASVHACGTNLTPTQILCARWCTRAPSKTHAMLAYSSPFTGIEGYVFQNYFIYIYIYFQGFFLSLFFFLIIFTNIYLPDHSLLFEILIYLIIGEKI